MSRAHELFERLRKGGLSALEELIADREPESLFLDFKRSPQDGAAKNLATEDNKNLSKAISGFANSSGGVVVWGVDCRRDSATGNEVAEKHPLIDASGFNTKLQAAVSRTTVPAHPGVQVLFFDEPGRSPCGYVVVYVPQSLIGPIRSLATNHYYVRTGSDFGFVPHDVLAGMFGRIPQPKADLNLISHPVRLDASPGNLTIAFGFVAVNLGAVVGERPYLSVFIGDLPQKLLTVLAPDPRNFSVRRSPIPTFSVVSSAGFLLTPGATEHICDILIDVSVTEPRAIKLECTLGVLGAPPERFTLTASEDAVRAAIAQARAGHIQSSDIVKLLPES
ncbi:MAG: ATP-binding protein [Candidatus Competibacter sp.]|nr:ATP-binding protein [Candidatus Competibacter sp.]